MKRTLRVALACALAPAAAAERPGPVIEEVVVTAAKREQGLYEVPASLSVLGGEALPERGIADLVDVGKFVPNLTVTNFGAGHGSSANPFIRGIGTQDHLITQDPGVGVYVDGVYLGRQVGQHWDLANIERVEVLRGPQGTLYGRNSIGGAINIVTARPGTYPGARLGVRVGSRGRADASFFGDRQLTDTLAATVSASARRRGGSGEFRNLPDADVDVGQTRELAARVAFAWQPTDALSIGLVVDANDGAGGLNPYTTLIDEVPHGAVYAAGYRNADVAADPYDNNTGQAAQARVGNEAQGIALSAEWAFAERLTGKVLGSRRRSEYRAGLDDDGFLDDFLSFPEVGDAEQTSIEARLHGDYERTRFVAGVYRYSEDGGNVQKRTVFLGFPGAFELSQGVASSAAFASIERDLSPRWRLAAGLRGTKDRKDAVTDVGIGPVAASRRWRETSWDASLGYAIAERLTVYGALQSGYQSGQFPARPYCLFADPDCFAASGNVTALNHEVGIKGQPRAGLELAAAIFRTRYRDLPYQVSTTAGDGFNTVNLIVDQDTTGIEWESTFYLSTALRAHLTLGWLAIEVERQGGVRPVAPLTPELTFSISPEYRRALANGGEAAARLDYSHRGAMWGEPSSDPARLTRIASRSIVNFHVGYTAANDAWRVAAYARNATDARYDQARLNTGDYLLRILSNDASEFGVYVSRQL